MFNLISMTHVSWMMWQLPIYILHRQARLHRQNLSFNILVTQVYLSHLWQLTADPLTPHLCDPSPLCNPLPLTRLWLPSSWHRTSRPSVHGRRPCRLWPHRAPHYPRSHCWPSRRASPWGDKSQPLPRTDPVKVQQSEVHRVHIKLHPPWQVHNGKIESG